MRVSVESVSYECQLSVSVEGVTAASGHGRISMTKVGPRALEARPTRTRGPWWQRAQWSSKAALRAASGAHLVLKTVTRPQFSSVNCTAQPEVRRVVAAVPPPAGLLRVELVEAALLAKHR